MTPLDMTDADANWLAGILDADGCFDSTRGNPRIRLKMVDFDLILRADRLLGGTMHEVPPAQPHHKPLMVAQVHGDQAVLVMGRILPYLSARRTATVTQLITRHIARKNHKVRLIRPEESAA